MTSSIRSTILDVRHCRLPDALRLQWHVLEEKRRRLERAIAAIQEAERSLEAGSLSDAIVLKHLIEVIDMEHHIDTMKKYFSEEAWAKWQHRWDRWPTPEWRALCQQIEAALEEDPASETAQSLADRWLRLVQADTGGDRAVQFGLWRALVNHPSWPAALKQRLAPLDVDKITRFINEAVCVKYETERQQHGTSVPRAPDRVNESRRVLFREIEAVVGDDPRSERVRPLIDRWNELLDDEAGGDPTLKSLARETMSRRQSWPAGVRRDIASLYDRDFETWDTVMNFIERANASAESA